MAPAVLLNAQPGEYVLDLCAAPGGKSSLLAASLRGEGLLVSCEPDSGRASILSSTLERLGVSVWPSEANFLLVRMPDAHRVRCLLRDEHSILVRDFSSTPGLKDCLRVTVGTPAENDEVVSAISQILSRED